MYLVLFLSQTSRSYNFLILFYLPPPKKEGAGLRIPLISYVINNSVCPQLFSPSQTYNL